MLMFDELIISWNVAIELKAQSVRNAKKKHLRFF